MGHRVLIVDDDIEVRELLAAALETRGCVVGLCATLAEAREHLRAGPADLAVIDGFLPDGSGIAFIQELREQGSNLKVAFLSALWRDEGILKRLTEELGVVRVLHKPLSVSSFLVQVMSVLEPAERLKVTWTPPSSRRGGRDRPEVERVPERAPERVSERAPERVSERAPEPPPPRVEPPRPGRPRADALRERYLRGLPARIEELEQTLHEALRPPGSADLLLAAAELCERIRNSAVGFGLEEPGRAAERVSRCLTAMLEGNPVMAAGLDEHLDALRGLAERARSFGSAQDQDVDRGLYGARLMVVSPSREVLELARERGALMLLDVVTAESSAEALQAAAARKPDLTFVDLPIWPEGAALAEQLRRLPGLGALPVAYLEQLDAPALDLPPDGPTLVLSRALAPEELGLALCRVPDRESLGVPTVLVVDDDPNFCRVMSALLARAGVSAATLTHPERTLAMLGELRPDLLVLDALMPRVGGLELCRLVRARPGWDELPVVLLTGAGGRDVVLAGLEAGADDVFLKGIDPGELLARLKARLERSRLLRARSDRDALTGLLNRRAFTEACRARLEECRRIRRELTLVILGIPELEELARTSGMRAGEDALTTAARLVSAETRAYDLRGRWGRAELAVAFAGAEREAALAVVERVRERLMAVRFGGQGRPLRVTLSVGSFPGDGRTLEDLVRAALASPLA